MGESKFPHRERPGRTIDAYNKRPSAKFRLVGGPFLRRKLNFDATAAAGALLNEKLRATRAVGENERVLLLSFCQSAKWEGHGERLRCGSGAEIMNWKTLYNRGFSCFFF